MRAVDSLYGASVLPILTAPKPPAMPRKLLRDPSAAGTFVSVVEFVTGLKPGVAATSTCVSIWNTILLPPPMSWLPRKPKYDRLLEISDCQPILPVSGAPPPDTLPELRPLVASSIDRSRWP